MEKTCLYNGVQLPAKTLLLFCSMRAGYAGLKLVPVCGDAI